MSTTFLTSQPHKLVRPPFLAASFAAGLLLAALFVSGANAQTEQPAVANAADTAKPSRPAVEVRQVRPVPSPGIADIIKMLDAGVSAEVIKAYIENSSSAWNPTPADLIALKDHGVTDDITMVLMKRISEAKARLAQAAAAAPEPRASARTTNPAYLDPESYEFFQYYYLFPRTLSYTYQTLGNTPGYSYGYGYYPSAPYGQYYGPGYVHPRRSFPRYGRY